MKNLSGEVGADLYHNSRHKFLMNMGGTLRRIEGRITFCFADNNEDLALAESLIFHPRELKKRADTKICSHFVGKVFHVLK